MGNQSNSTAAEPFNVMAMPHGPVCNLDCDYCYYLEKTEHFSSANSPADYRMDDDVLETFVAQYIEGSPAPVVEFAWQGGEPTLAGLDFFERVVELQESYAPPGTEVRNAIQTNGTTLDDEWCEFFETHDFLVGISLDGPKALHDGYRTRKDGTGSFESVLDGLKLLQSHDIEYNVLCTVNGYNVKYPLEVYQFFKQHDVEWLQFIPIVNEVVPGTETKEPNDGDVALLGKQKEPPTYRWAEVESRTSDPDQRDAEDAVVTAARDASVSLHSVDPVEYGRFLKAIFDEWVRNDIGDVSVQLFDIAVEAWVGASPSMCVFSETCGRQVALEQNGDVFACDHFVDSGYERGNVQDTHLRELVDHPDQRRFGEFKRAGLPEYCETCEVQFACHGGCPKNRILDEPHDGLNYLCPSYKAFFTYIEPYTNLIAKRLERGESLATVRSTVRELDQYFEREVAGT